MAQYTPEVEKISTSGGKMYVTVGYIPTTSNSASGELALTAPTEPVKYMDYVFTRGENRDWYLTALQESEMQVEATPEPSPTAAVTQDTQSMVESQLNSAMTDAASSTVENPDQEEAVPAEETPAEEPGAESSEETSGEPESTDAASDSDEAASSQASSDADSAEAVG